MIRENKLILKNIQKRAGVISGFFVFGNNAGTVTGAMNFFGQMGTFFLALIFGQIVQATHRFDYPVYLVGAVLIIGCLLWLGIDAEKGLPEVGDGGERGKTRR